MSTILVTKAILTMIFYKLEFMVKIQKDSDGCGWVVNKGYYLTKRVWVWLLLFPAIYPLQVSKDIVALVVNRLINYIPSVFTYQCRRIVTNKKQNLSLKDKINYINSLSK
ncbi:MAG: hypothetical protein ACRDD8_06170 [Bacteroidales bacterium]